MRRFFSSFLEVFEVAVIAIGSVFLIRNFLVQPFLVSGASMVPTFSNGDYLLIDELTYRLRAPERGEVTVFRYPKDAANTYFIKRIIGLPGEKIDLVDGKVVVRNDQFPDGFPLDESYLTPGVQTQASCGKSSFVLGKDEYLAFGDNRLQSFDSRCWGTLPAKDIVGVVRLRLWPPRNATVFAAPKY